MITISDKIRHIRELKDLTQEYMANKLGITQSGYSKIEMGTVDVTYSKLTEIAEALSVKVEDIVCFDGQKYFHSFNKVSDSYNVNHHTDALATLYNDNVKLLQRLLNKTEIELQKYRDKFGDA
jgi:transcriptional regulator with XRE-family HTH domain